VKSLYFRKEWIPEIENRDPRAGLYRFTAARVLSGHHTPMDGALFFGKAWGDRLPRAAAAAVLEDLVQSYPTMFPRRVGDVVFLENGPGDFFVLGMELAAEVPGLHFEDGPGHE
jgi:hypothetical protein